MDLKERGREGGKDETGTGQHQNDVPGREQMAEVGTKVAKKRETR